MTEKIIKFIKLLQNLSNEWNTAWNEDNDLVSTIFYRVNNDLKFGHLITKQYGIIVRIEKVKTWKKLLKSGNIQNNN